MKLPTDEDLARMFLNHPTTVAGRRALWLAGFRAAIEELMRLASLPWIDGPTYRLAADNLEEELAAATTPAPEGAERP